MRWLTKLLGLLMLAERAWKHYQVIRFFGRKPPPPHDTPELVSILQPILSGDPTMPDCLEQNLRFQSRYPREYIWLVDDDDLAGQRICEQLIARHPDMHIRLLRLPPPSEHQNPKMVKLIAGAEQATGDILCILDDDTMLPDRGLERCLPYLDQPGAGLVFGLPYYVNFSNRWSSLLSYFVDSHSLMTYIPYISVAEPFTINGMFYSLRRKVWTQVGGFEGLEQVLADDFAVAQRIRAHGYRLTQTPLCHGISTQVTSARHYLSLMQRWFIFPRESLLRHLGGRDRLVLISLGLLPAFFPLLTLVALIARPGRRTATYALAYFGYRFAIFAHINHAYLHDVAPWRQIWWVPLLEVAFPIQLLAALLAPQRIVWRGHIIEAEAGGGFRLVQRRE